MFYMEGELNLKTYTFGIPNRLSGLRENERPTKLRVFIDVRILSFVGSLIFIVSPPTKTINL